ncbi:phosphoinositide 3-kinase regulatory subunit 4-like [Varroa destructor]|uniref:non-specific serine/threonine protein kinase n=1 Tax=Varroa destructor TaxID=109461 RepID=A0A7M7K2J1_VARDE|nr:phosphoinositide 3-kinase regulatory subunit 4-like [Varroa destructor]
MGNTLVSYAPSTIHSVDEYLADLPEYQRELNLGSTRFLKTVKVRAANCQYPLVVKVLALPQDNTLPLQSHQKNIEKIRNALENCPNALPFTKTYLSARSAILVRQFVKYSLYDRVSTRPFLTISEKKWIAFQLLCALAQCHRAEVCHGDIKLENILVTGWNWVALTDFASFKPTMMPMDNPTEFFYFFDTSRRQVCCIAPERFYRHRTVQEEILEEPRAELTSAMDIFSLGCVFIELFTDGKFPFKLSDMYKYKQGETDRPPQLQEISDEGIRELAAHMIQREPQKRFTADKYLDMCRKNQIFPSCFFTGLLDYLKLYALDTSHPDSQIFRLFKDHEVFLEKIADSEEGVLALVNFITAMLRSLKHSSAKMVGLKLIKVCASRLAPFVILERLSPFVLHMLQDPSAQVVSEAIHVLTDCLSYIQSVPMGDSFVFVEYIMPELQKASVHTNDIVRLALAANLGRLAETALSFLETSHLNCADVGSKEDVSSQHLYRSSYERELGLLHDAVQNIVATLISDHCNQVKRMLLEKGATKLCVFFGEESAHDVLLSHMITFLNDSADHELRASFYTSVAGVAVFVGTTVTSILMPLIEQGFNDSHDAVVCSTLKCVTALTEIHFFRRGTLCTLFSQALHLLKHRNTWIRVETAHFLACVARNVPLAIKECRLRPFLKPFLECPAVQIEKAEVIIGCLAKRDVPGIQRASVYGKSEASGDLAKINLEEKNWKGKSKEINIKETHRSEDVLCEALLQYCQLENLLNKKKQCVNELRAVDVEANDLHFSQAWKPKGTLMAHMHEHQGAINKVCVLPDAVFATCSSDGTVRLWDWTRMEKRVMTNKSIYTYDRLTGQLVSMDYCVSEQCVLVASNSGNMEVFKLEPGSNAGPQFISGRCLDPLNEGWAVDVKPAGGSVMAYASLYGGICGWDLRTPGTTWRLRNDAKCGLNMCMAIDSSRHWLVTATNEGFITCWDLRFHLPIAKIQHPYKFRTYKLLIPKHCNNGSVWAAHFSNHEVSLWNLENQQRSKTLWASKCSPFTDREFTKSVAYGICQADQHIFTGGTDMRIRCWDVSDNEKGYRNSYLVTGSAMDGDRITASYFSIFCDGTQVIQEQLRKNVSEKSEYLMGSRAAAGHKDCVSELAILRTTRNFLVSTSTEGVLKIWK